MYQCNCLTVFKIYFHLGQGTGRTARKVAKSKRCAAPGDRRIEGHHYYVDG